VTLDKFILLFYKELQQINCRLSLIHHIHGVRFRNAACESTCDCKQSDNPFGEFTKRNMKLQNCGINKHLEEFIPLDNIRNIAGN
jgi:hypothetical protein